MKATVIISIYKNVRALQAVLDSLKRQTEQDFELILSEDGEDKDMAAFVNGYLFPWQTQHLTQEDTGWRKERALNRAVVAAHTDWLIFVDGDCVLHPRFVEMHIKYAQLVSRHFHIKLLHKEIIAYVWVISRTKPKPHRVAIFLVWIFRQYKLVVIAGHSVRIFFV